MHNIFSAETTDAVNPSEVKEISSPEKSLANPGKLDESVDIDENSSKETSSAAEIESVKTSDAPPRLKIISPADSSEVLCWFPSEVFC